jgi:hypothetical protein
MERDCYIVAMGMVSLFLEECHGSFLVLTVFGLVVIVGQKKSFPIHPGETHFHLPTI